MSRNHSIVSGILKRAITPRSRYAIRNYMVNYFPNTLLQRIDEKHGICFPHYYVQEKIIFIHVPKSAGVSIAMSIYGRQITHLPAEFFRKANPMLFDSLYSFSVVRNPYERIVSAYYYAKGGGTKTMPIHKPAQYKTPEFESFGRFVMEWLPRNLYTDFVFRPQVSFLTDTKTKKVIVNDIYDLSALDECEEKLSEVVGRRIEFQRLNVANERVDHEAHHDEDTRKVIQQLYEEDFALLDTKKMWIK